jgi:acetyl esterase/lipase
MKDTCLMNRFSKSVLALLLAATLWSAIPGAVAAGYQRTEDVIYGRKHGVALTMDVFRPEQTNGCGVVFMVSGGWFSAKEMVNPAFFQAFLDRGYTVFAVVHGSQPKYTVPEIIQDVHRAVRFIRHRAGEYGVRPDKLGVAGASAGGHLSLMLGTRGGPGKADAKDPVDRESSAVAAVACFFPPTDFLNYGNPGEDAVGVGVLLEFKPAFGPRSDTPESRKSLGKEISSACYVTGQTAPTLIIHGDADRLVPIQQAQLFIDKAKAAGVAAELVVREGKAHGWPEIGSDVPLLAGWFDRHLRGLPAAQATP